jgi:hypothetical protein
LHTNEELKDGTLFELFKDVQALFIGGNLQKLQAGNGGDISTQKRKKETRESKQNEPRNRHRKVLVGSYRTYRKSNRNGPCRQASKDDLMKGK